MKAQCLVLLIVLAPLSLQAAGSSTPGAGSILQQVNPVEPPTPSSTGSGMTIERQGGGKLPPSAPFEVKSIQITGNTLFDIPTLHALVADAEGTSLSLSRLDELAIRITDYYHSHGYPLARAIIPAQTIQAGVVRIEVIEARYGKIKLDNHSRVIDPLLESTLSSLQGGQIIGQAAMDRTLLLLTDIPGVVVNASLKPGDTVGTSDLAVDAASGPVVTGNIALNNYGNRYTGRVRASGAVSFNNPLHHGDSLSFSGLTSGSELNYGRVAYDTLLNGLGTRMGGSYSSLHYKLGDTLVPLKGHGTAQVQNLWMKHTLLRSLDVNFYGQIQYDKMQLRDHLDAPGMRTDRHLDNWTASLSGDARDALLSAVAINSWNLSGTTGHVGFDNEGAQLTDAATVKSQGRFTKWNATLARLQNMNSRNSLYLTAYSQWANGNLDSSQKMAVSGPYTVRAYDTGAASGDAGYVATAEIRHDLGQAGQWQAVVFVDTAQVTINKKPWSTASAELNSATLSGVGVGLKWAGPNQWSARTYIATPVGSTPALAGSTASVRAWVEIGKGV